MIAPRVIASRWCSTLHQPRRFRLTFFTKDGCQLCKNAATILHDAIETNATNNVSLKVINILDAENSEAFDLYCYDVPVLHIEKDDGSKMKKFMHYFNKDKIMEEIGSNTR